jgi:hypothetical protein
MTVMALSSRTKLGIIIAVSVVAGLAFVWLALLLLLLAAFLIAWGQAPERTEEFVKGLRCGNSIIGALEKWVWFDRNDSASFYARRRLWQMSASKMPILSRSMVEFDQLMSALFLLALLLYLVQSVFRLEESRRWLRLGAILTLGTAMAIAVVESIMWFIHWRACIYA